MCRSPRLPTALAIGTSCEATRRRHAGRSSARSSRAVGPDLDSSCRRWSSNGSVDRHRHAAGEDLSMPRKSTKLSADTLRELARKGAAQAVKELRAEIIAIERAFPELKLPGIRRNVRLSVQKATRRARTMSAAARSAVSRRMKRYWAERRKAKAKLKTK